MARGKKKTAVLSPEQRLQQALVSVEEQPYKVPENWCWTYVGAISILVGGGTPNKSNPKYWNGDIPWASVKDVKGDYLYTTLDSITHEGLENSAANLCDVDDLILVTRIEPAKTIVATIVSAINQDLKILKSPLSSVFLHYYFKNFRHWFEMKSSGSTVKGITVANIQNTHFPLPPLPEQQRIVDRIESLFAKLDEAKEKVQAVVDGFDEIKQAFLYQAFSGNLTEHWRNAFHISKQETWQTRTLQSVCTMKITDGTHKTPTYCDADEGVPFISAKDVTTGVICWDNIKYIIPELHEELYERLAPQVDDVLLAKNGTTGVAAIVEEDKVFDLYVTLAVLRPNKDIIDPRFLLNVVNSPICKRQFDEHLTGIGVPNLHLRDIKEVEIALPSLDEQRELVRIIDDMSEKWNKAQNAAELVLDKINTMKKSILALAFRGELGTNDPNDESAVELLKSVL